ARGAYARDTLRAPAFLSCDRSVPLRPSSLIEAPDAFRLIQRRRMRRRTTSLRRVLPDGTALHNRLLGALPAREYHRICEHLRMHPVRTGETLQEHGAPISHVYFPNGGVYSITNQMRDGALVEVATFGSEGMLGIGAFFGDRSGAGRAFQQVGNGLLPAMPVARFIKEIAIRGPLRDVVGLYAQAN